MARSVLRLTTGDQLLVEGSLGDVEKSLRDANGGWVTVTTASGEPTLVAVAHVVRAVEAPS